MSDRLALPVGVGGVQAGIAAAGFADRTVRPAASVATHSDVAGQEMPVSSVLSIDAGADQAGESAVGFVEISASPRLSTATQSDVETHETPSRCA
jgi:hypothetical protein